MLDLLSKLNQDYGNEWSRMADRYVSNLIEEMEADCHIGEWSDDGSVWSMYLTTADVTVSMGAEGGLTFDRCLCHPLLKDIVLLTSGVIDGLQPDWLRLVAAQALGNINKVDVCESYVRQAVEQLCVTDYPETYLIYVVGHCDDEGE